MHFGLVLRILEKNLFKFVFALACYRKFDWGW